MLAAPVSSKHVPRESGEKIIIGFDCGGNYSDCVAVNNKREILGSIKVPTTKDVYSGIEQSLKNLFKEYPELNPKDFYAFNLGTTALVNSIIQASDDLSFVALFRLCGQASNLIPPFCGFTKAESLRSRVELAKYLCSGGYELSQEETMPIDEEEIKKYCEDLTQICQTKKLKKVHIVVSACFSTSIDYEKKSNQEYQAKNVIEEAMMNKNIETSFTLSQELIGTKLLLRENTAIFNESLKNLAEKHISAYQYALMKSGLSHVSFHLVQNDGTLIKCEEAKKYPVKTFFSGPCNSVKGAYELSKLPNAYVMDIGGTSLDYSKVNEGEANLQLTNVTISSVSTSLIAHKSNSIGLGGGSIVEIDNTGNIKVGPKSIGYEQKKAKAFGGSVLTTLVVAIGLGLVTIKETSKESVLKDVPEETLNRVYDHYIGMVQACIDEMKNEKEDLPLVLVGGGSVLINRTKNSSE